MNEQTVVLLDAIENMNSSQDALNYIEKIKRNYPFQLFASLIDLILAYENNSKLTSSCIVLISSIMKPTICRPLDVLTQEFQAFDQLEQEKIKRAFFKCLLFPEQLIRLNAAKCIGFFAKIELPKKKWHDVFKQLNSFSSDGNEWAAIGAISAMKEILTEVTILQRWPLYKVACGIVFNSCMNILSKNIDPEMKIEPLKCLKVAIKIFIPTIQDEQFYQSLLELLMLQIQIENVNFHNCLIELFSTFLIRIYHLLNGKVISDIINPLIPDLIGVDENRKLHVIRLCKKFAIYESKLGQNSKSYTELFEQNFDRVMLDIIRSGDFSDLNEAESIWITPHEALDCLFEFGKVSPARLFNDCIAYYQEFIQKPESNFKLSSLCAAQVISSIHTDYASEFIEQQLELIIQLGLYDDTLVRTSAFSVVQSIVEEKLEVIVKKDCFKDVLYIIQCGLNMDIVTAIHALNVFKKVCECFVPDGNDSFLSINYENIMNMLLSLTKRNDIFCDQFIEEVGNTIFIYLQHLPFSRRDQLINFLDIVIKQLAQTLNNNDSDDRVRSYSLYLIVGIVQSLGHKISPYGEALLKILLQLIQENKSVDCAIVTISQVVFYIGNLSSPFIPQIINIIEKAQTSNSVQDINASSMLLGSIVLQNCNIPFDVVLRLFNLVCNNLTNDATLLSSVSPLLFAINDIMKGLAMFNINNARQIVEPTMSICSNYVKNLEFIVSADYDAAISISTALMSVFIITIEVCFQDDSFSEGLQFIANNLKSIFIQVPLIVWKHQMITRKTVEVFLNLMHCLIRHVGRDNNIELHNRSLQAFLKLTVSENSPYPDLIQTANTVMKFYSDI